MFFLGVLDCRSAPMARHHPPLTSHRTLSLLLPPPPPSSHPLPTPPSAAETVVYRIFYHVNRSGTGRISLRELRRSNFPQALEEVEEEEDINKVLRCEEGYEIQVLRIGGRCELGVEARGRTWRWKEDGATCNLQGTKCNRILRVVISFTRNASPVVSDQWSVPIGVCRVLGFKGRQSLRQAAPG